MGKVGGGTMSRTQLKYPTMPGLRLRIDRQLRALKVPPDCATYRVSKGGAAPTSIGPSAAASNCTRLHTRDFSSYPIRPDSRPLDYGRFW